MFLAPGAGGELGGFGEGGVDVDGAHQFLQAEAPLHGEDELRHQVAGVMADDGDA